MYVKFAEKKKRINFKRIGEFRGLSSVDGYKINWSRIISILNEYAQELRRDKEVALRTAQNKLLKECDYLVIKITDQTPQWQKNFMMQIKAQGKHGTVIK